MLNWESHWAPYDEATYQQALAWVGPDDVALEIGAGDLRLARRLAGRARQVYAIEMTAALLDQAAHDPTENLQIICSDARTYPFPMGVTVGVLLMRHCRHFHLYVQKLKAARCAYLITNARWRMGVERVDLRQPRHSFALVPYGWYACLCGNVGFIPGPADALTWADLDLIHEVTGCPQCDETAPVLISTRNLWSAL